ncbi:MAG TPA: imidazole glycerol phosphate synthase subunit HisH [Actinomycetota bacterium]
MITVAILDYGMGNLRSVARAVERVGGKPDVTDDAAQVARADALVVPGVGHFGACMRNLREQGLDAAILGFAAGGRPVFGVCLGMQVLFESSEESDEPGLGLLPGRVARLPQRVRVPHIGWNTVTWTGTHPYVQGIADRTRFSFVHSYAADVDDTTTLGVTEHGRPFASVVGRGNLFATQFHPEKSGAAGLAVYEAFVREGSSL